MLGELDFYLPKSFCSTNVYGEYTEGKNSIVGLVRTVLVCRIQSFPRRRVRVGSFANSEESGFEKALSPGPSIDRTDQFLRDSHSRAHCAGEDRGEDQETEERPCCLLCFPV